MSGTSRLKVAGEFIVIRTDRPSGWVQHTIVWLNTQDLPFDSYCLGVASQGEASSSEVWRRAQTEMQNGGRATCNAPRVTSKGLSDLPVVKHPARVFWLYVPVACQCPQPADEALPRGLGRNDHGP